MPDVIVAKRICKRFKEITAVDDLSFSVPQGMIYGFLGQNGAGKSTTIRMLLTLIQPSAGEIEILGMNLNKKRREILSQTGAIIERPELYNYLSALENLRIFASISGSKLSTAALMDQLDKVGLADRASSKVKTFSQGMKQRLGIAVALVHNPQLIILDEPTNGLDPQGIADVRQLVLHLSRSEGKTLLISSHLLSEMELIADNMLIIDRGRKIVEGRTADLLNPVHTMVELVPENFQKAIAFINRTKWNGNLKSTVNGLVRLSMDKSELPLFSRELIVNGVDIVSIKPVHTLEEYFLSLTR